ncbi:MAG: agmatinase [Cytophagaceae bacterium]|nr:agmatinase [Gemmatimonadaceae bacterium]
MTAPGQPVLLGVPFDAASSALRGSAAAPPAIRRELHSDSSNLWSEAFVDLAAPGAFGDAGDVTLGATPRDDIQAAVMAILREGGRPVVLGGDHSITHPEVSAVRERHPRLSILHFDAHNDLYDHYEGDRHSHACPFARIMEAGLCDQLVQVGIRASTRHQREQAVRFGVDVIDMRRWAAGDRPSLRHPVYISLDVDVLDPASAPGVSHREGGGLTTREVVTQLHAVRVPIVGADLVEYNPSRDLGDVTASACAKLLKELLATMIDCPLPDASAQA